MKLIDDSVSWFLKPFVEGIFTDKKEDKLPKIQKSTVKHYSPSTFDEYIGQNKVKSILKNYILGTIQRNVVFPHTLISGGAGYGKSTLAEIISKNLEVLYNTSIGSNIVSHEQINNKILLVEGGVLIVDEIHAIKRDICEKFYPFMEASDFTLIGTTTELGEILKDRRPFYDRFKIILELDIYNIENLVKIACQYKNKTFPNENISNREYETLALNSRGCPRNIIRLLEATIYFNNNINKVLYSFGIIKNGYTTKDITVLEYLKSNIEGVGINNISIYLNTSSENYLYEIEPYLLKNNLIIRTYRGRKITKNGIRLLEELKNS
jgi:Holliday junction DNA helicase RuvB